ncbi:MAG: flagellar hook-length control protein FliK, partial [Rubritepida sp.]|nr:flagellar hook-length control protein FliK [Rubritepida sp.]
MQPGGVPGAEAEAGFGALLQRAVVGLGVGAAGLPGMAVAGFGAMSIASAGAVPLEAMVALPGEPPEVTVPLPTLLPLREGEQAMLPADDVPLPDISQGGVPETLQAAPAMPTASLPAPPPPAVFAQAPAGQGTAGQPPELVRLSASEKPMAATLQQAAAPPALSGAAADATPVPEAAALVDAHPLPLPPAPPTAGQAPPVYLALPPGIVPRLVPAKASPQPVADMPRAMADRTRPPLASPGVGPPAEPASAEAAPAAWIDPAPRAPSLPVTAIPGAKSQASQPVEGLAPAPPDSPEPAAPLPITAPALVASEPAHIAPPSPTRQVLPITIAMLISAGTTPTLTVTLEPGEMGQVEIRVGRDADGTTLRLIAERPETTALMQRDGRELQQGLAQSGIRLAADAISFETAGGGSGQPGERPAPPDPGPRP